MKILELVKNYLLEGDTNRARDLVLRYRLIPGQTPDEYYQWGKICEELSLPYQALECYRKALSIDPYHPTTLYQLASLLYELGDLDQAKRTVLRLLAYEHDHVEGKKLLAQIYKELGEDGSLEVICPQEKTTEIGPRLFPRDFAPGDIKNLEEFLYGRKSNAELILNPLTGEKFLVFYNKPITQKLFSLHLQGKKYLLAYPISEDLKVKWATFSIMVPQKEVARHARDKSWKYLKAENLLFVSCRAYKKVLSLGLSAALEVMSPFSYRLIFLFTEAIHFLWAKRFLENLSHRLPYPEGGVSYIPFNLTYPEGAGWQERAIPLPLGREPATKIHSFLIDEDGHKIEDSIEFLKKLRRISFQEIKKFSKGETKIWQSSYPKSHLLKKLYKKCPLVGAIAKKAEEGRPLNRHEQLALFLTVGLLDKDGRILHELLYSIPDYRYLKVEKIRNSLPKNPISCYKLREWFPQLADLFLCACSFEDTGRYPSPLLHVKPELVGPIEEISLKTKKPEEIARFYVNLLSEKKRIERRIKIAESELKRYLTAKPKRRISVDNKILFLENEELKIKEGK